MLFILLFWWHFEFKWNTKAIAIAKKTNTATRAVSGINQSGMVDKSSSSDTGQRGVIDERQWVNKTSIHDKTRISKGACIRMISFQSIESHVFDVGAGAEEPVSTEFRVGSRASVSVAIVISSASNSSFAFPQLLLTRGTSR